MYELWKGRKPKLNHLRVWGCLAFYKAVDPKRTKLRSRANNNVFVGYSESSKAYMLLDLNSNIIVESRDVEFFENKFSKDSTDDNIMQTQGTVDHGSSSSKTRKVPDPPMERRKSQRTRKVKYLDPDFISPDFIVFLVEDSRTTILKEIRIILNVKGDPKTFKEAMASRDSTFWKEAINDETDSLLANNTWVLTDLPLALKQLAVNGFKQKEDVYYFNTYALVARITSIKVLLSLASIYKFHVHQMDVKTTFLSGDLDGEVYMELLEGFVLPKNENKVCKLTKSLYGLKQAPK